MRKFVLIVLFIFLLTAKIVSYSEGKETNWIELFSYPDGMSVHYDPESVSHPSKKIINIMFKNVGGLLPFYDISDGSNKEIDKTKTLDEIRKGKEHTVKYKEIIYELEQLEFNCSNKTYRHVYLEKSIKDMEHIVIDAPDPTWHEVDSEYGYYLPHYKYFCTDAHQEHKQQVKEEINNKGGETVN